MDDKWSYIYLHIVLFGRSVSRTIEALSSTAETDQAEQDKFSKKFAVSYNTDTQTFHVDLAVLQEKLNMP